MQFTIDRSTWRFGGSMYIPTDGATLLLNDCGLMCCLGHVSIQLGVPKERLEYINTPLALHVDNILAYEKYGQWFNTKLATRAMAINDSSMFTNEEREENLIALFQEYGHELTFTGEYRCHLVSTTSTTGN